MFILTVVVLIGCKSESKQRTKSPTKPPIGDPGPGPACSGSDCYKPSVNKSYATYRIRKNGVDDGSYPTSLIAGVSNRTVWAFDIVLDTARNSATNPSSGNPEFKARVKNGFVANGINIRKEGNVSFAAEAMVTSPTSGQIALEVLDVTACRATNRYGNSCGDEITYPSELVQSVMVPYLIQAGITTGSNNQVTCALIDAGGNILGSVDGNDDNQNSIFDSIINVGQAILDRNNDCI